jgi:WD40 repeat protein
MENRNRECLKTITAHTRVIVKIVLISNDRFATCSFDKTIKLFDLNTYECIRTFIGHEGIFYCIEKFLNDKIISYSRDKTIRMWDLN